MLTLPVRGGQKRRSQGGGRKKQRPGDNAGNQWQHQATSGDQKYKIFRTNNFILWLGSAEGKAEKELNFHLPLKPFSPWQKTPRRKKLLQCRKPEDCI
jgi:hypothetical protein